jgi:tetratricopeptide (TPR) repeat protein
VSENKVGQIAILDSRSLPVRIVLVLAIISAIAFGWFAARWQLGNMLASLTSSNDPNSKEIAALAARLSPRDPLTSWLLASIRKDTFTPEAIAASIDGFEQVIKLAPNDFRWWIELGHAREQAEEAEAAEKAYLRAVEVAPEYTYPRWQLGNFYLRQGRGDEAFTELKKAAESNSVYRDQVFSIAWDYYEQDTNRLEEIAGNAPAVRANLARFYAARERADDSLRIWNSLSEQEQRMNADYGKVIAQAFYEKRFFRQSIEFVRTLGIEPEAQHETIQNAGFEKTVGSNIPVYFNWRIATIDKMDVKPDPTKKQEGARSLRVLFNGYSEAALYNITQFVTTEPNAKYRLTFWVRTENLKSGGNPTLEVYNPNDSRSLAVAEAFPTGTNDWQQMKVEFTAPADSQAVGIRTIRIFCGNDCPIFGTFWYDDFKLEKIK